MDSAASCPAHDPDFGQDLNSAQLGSGSLLRRCLSAVEVTLSIWMQTTGTTLLVAKLRSPMRVRMSAQDGHSARRLLYLAAVRGTQKAGPKIGTGR